MMIQLFMLKAICIILLMALCFSCGGQQAKDVVVDDNPEEMMELMCGRFDGCREMTDRELEIWFYL